MKGSYRDARGKKRPVEEVHHLDEKDTKFHFGRKRCDSLEKEDTIHC